MCCWTNQPHSYGNNTSLARRRNLEVFASWDSYSDKLATVLYCCALNLSTQIWCVLFPVSTSGLDSPATLVCRAVIVTTYILNLIIHWILGRLNLANVRHHFVTPPWFQECIFMCTVWFDWYIREALPFFSCRWWKQAFFPWGCEALTSHKHSDWCQRQQVTAGI